MDVEINGATCERAGIHAALADPQRLQITDRLAVGDASPTDLQRAIGMPSNLLSHHLRVLEAAGVIRRSRSQSDRRRTYVSLNHAAMQRLVVAPVRRARRVLFVCRENSARSQLAVAIWSRHAALPAASAGTHPGQPPDAAALEAARRRHMPMYAWPPRHLDEVLTLGDLVVTVCDRAHEELGEHLKHIHWSIADPAGPGERGNGTGRGGTPDAYERTLDALTARIDHLEAVVQPL